MTIDGMSGAVDRIVFERGGRRTAVRLPRHGVAFAGALVAALAAWSVAAGAYVLFHDAVVAGLRSSAHATAKGYEAQIAALKDELERSRTRRLVEKSGVEERLALLGRRQEALEKRQARLGELAELAPAAANAASTYAVLAYSAKPTPLGEAETALDGAEALPGDGPLRSSHSEKLSASLDALELRQERTLDALAEKTAVRRVKLERIYNAAGLPKPTVVAARDGKGRGGPYAPPPVGAPSFDDRVDRVAAEREVVEALDKGLDRLPIRTPAPGAAISSGFGTRTDPFLGRPAFHAGVDFDEDFGDAVRATAAGRVVWAGPSGGYGEMVEIDHGGGLATRFGHLSAIAVALGEEVKPGTQLGRVGSTGRSTGPHLHYETRLDGQAVDPLRFLRAGRLMVAED